ncbi:Fc.00g094790.m01.CDS01 [Cosmosporella sp. VM-42]
MDLMYDYPMLPKPDDGRVTHCGLNVGYDYRKGGRARKVDRSMPKQWAWRSSVCHRDSPHSPRKLPGHRVQPHADKCRFGESDCDACELWPGEWPAKCFLGVMGWLLSCRQAYIEGMPILYSTNTIHTSSKEMIMQLPRLLLPQRLASIKSMELVWEFVPFPRQGETRPTSPMIDLVSFYSFLDAFPSMLGHIRTLYISFQGQLKPHWTSFSISGNEWFQFTETLIMNPIDDMVRKLGPEVRDCSIAIPSSLYASRRDRAREAGELVHQTMYGGHIECHWRPLADSEHRSGYWVLLGQKDLGYPWPGCATLVSDDEDWVLHGDEWRS